MSNKKVLIVDDSVFFQKALKKIVNTQGFDVELLSDGKEVLDTIEDVVAGVHCILLDIYMPQIDGISTLGHLRRHYPNLPIIVISSTNDNEDLEVVQKLGASAVINKGENVDQVEEKLSQALSNIA